MGVILREIIPDGTKWGVKGEILPAWTELEFGQDLKSAGSIRFSYATQGANYSLIKPGMFVVAEIDGRFDWYDSIYRINERTGSNTLNTPGKASFAGVSLRALLDDVRWMPAIGSAYIDSEGFRYNNATPGDVIRAGVINYMSRAKNTYKDKVAWLAAVVDAPATKWDYKLDELINPTTSVTDMIDRYQDLGIATARFDGFNLELAPYDWYVDSPTRDKTDTIQLKAGVNLTGADYSETDKSVVTALLVRGAQDPFPPDGENLQTNSIQWVIASQSDIDKYGYHESILDVGSASSPETLLAIGKNYLRNNTAPRYSTSYNMLDSVIHPTTGERLSVPSALLDFQSGDTILVLDQKGAVSEKVYAVSMTFNNPSRAGNISIVLNDYFDSWEVTFNQRLKRLEG